MDEMEVAVKFENHDQQIKSLKHRMDEQEEQSKTIQELVLSVRELALNMQAMLKEQGDQGKRLEKLEAEPAEKWSSMKRTVFNTMVGAGASALALGLIYLMAQYLK